MKNETEKIESLIITYLSGNASDKEKLEVENWLAVNEANKQQFAEVADIWDASSIKKPIESNTDARFKKLEKRIKTQKQIKINPSNIFKYAAVFVIAMGLGSLITFYLGSNNTASNKITENKIIAPKGSKTNLILPDGSEVWLNAGSSISYQDGFLSGKNREIKLIGEAFFKVSKNKEKPFIVHTKDAVVKALGTSFNVKAYPEEPTVEATLVEGSIAVYKIKEETEEIILKPNQQIVINRTNKQNQVANSKTNQETNNGINKIINSKISVQEDINVSKYTSWKDKSWIIENEELGVLAKKLERKYDVNIIFEDNKYRELRFSGTLMDESLEQVLEVISFASPVSFKVDGKKVILDSKRLH